MESGSCSFRQNRMILCSVVLKRQKSRDERGTLAASVLLRKVRYMYQDSIIKVKKIINCIVI